MAETAAGTRLYDVAVDYSTLKAEESSFSGVRYSVELSGPVDDHWSRSFHLVRTEATGFFRFRFDVATKRVSFSCRTTDGPTEVATILVRLDSLVSLVNHHASTGELI